MAESIGEDAISEDTNPSTEFENRGDQTREGGVVDASDARGPREAVHRENLAEHTLVVAIHESSAGEGLVSWSSTEAWREGGEGAGGSLTLMKRILRYSMSFHWL